MSGARATRCHRSVPLDEASVALALNPYAAGGTGEMTAARTV